MKSVEEYDQIAHETRWNPAMYIYKVYAHTKEDGILYLPCTAGTGKEETNSFICYKLKWDSPDCESLCSDLLKLMQKIENLAEWNEDIQHNKSQLKDILPTELYEVYRKYIEELQPKGIDRHVYQDLLAKKAAKEKMTLQEQSLYAYSFLGLGMEAKARIGGKFAAEEVIRHAQRLYLLFILQAPQEIRAEEEQYLAEACILNRFATAIDTEKCPKTPLRGPKTAKNKKI
jgi:hypothetical protein